MPSVPALRATAPHAVASRGGLDDLVPALLHLVQWPVRTLRARRELARLADLSEHELRDIGLTRQDIRGATALPLDEDPTRYLARTVWERRQAARPRIGPRR